MDYRRLWQFADGVGATLRRRHSRLHRPAPYGALLGGHEAVHGRSVPKSEGLARKQPSVEEHAGWIPGDPALPPDFDAKIPSTHRRGGIIQTGSPFDNPPCNEGLSSSRSEG